MGAYADSRYRFRPCEPIQIFAFHACLLTHAELWPKKERPMSTFAPELETRPATQEPFTGTPRKVTQHQTQNEALSFEK